MQFSVLNREGEIVSSIELDDYVFGIVPNMAVVHQAMVRQRANARQGSASTKTRGQVRGSTRKLFRQKGTGRARQGSIRAPHRRGGGVVFGPHPRSFAQRMPKKMRRLAIRSVLSAKAADEEILILDSLELGEPKTREVRQTLQTLGVNSSALLVTAEPDAKLYRSARNLERVKITPAPLINVVDLLSYKALIVSVDAARRIEEVWGVSRVGGRKWDGVRSLP